MLRCILTAILFTAITLATSGSAVAQLAPSIGYMYPPGGTPGATVDVVLGGYDWTPDMEVFVLQEGITLEIIGPPGPVIVPEPPYWFGKKARRGPFPMPREIPARLTIAADVPAGIVQWQVANANGASVPGRFVVGPAEFEEVLEQADASQPQPVGSLPAVVSGRIRNIEDRDAYRFRATRTGPITCTLVAGQIGSPLTAVVEVRDAQGTLVADTADTTGQGTAFTFAGREDEEYTVTLYDLDFRGNRSMVYRLSIAEAPQVLAGIPAAGVRGKTLAVEFVGYGIATGADRLESVVRDVAFPDDKESARFAYRLESSFGTAAAVDLLLTETPDVLATPGTHELSSLPVSVTGVLEEQYGEDRYRLAGEKGQVWSIVANSRRAIAPLDLSITVFDAEGTELKRADAALEFTVPEDGVYQIAVGDSSGYSGDRSAVYRLTIDKPRPGFELSVPEQLGVPIGGKVPLLVKAVRTGGFLDPITLHFDNLPAGVSVPEELTIPARQVQLRVEVEADAGAAALAGFATLRGTATVDEQELTGTAANPMLIATTIPPPFEVDAEGKDDVTKWPRGTTFPGPVLIERTEGFHGEIVLEMSARQGRHRQGIRGPELVVGPDERRVLYPIFLPEWLETTRTSRMVCNGVAQVADPQGNVRHSLVRLKTRIGFLPTGALLKIAAQDSELVAAPDQPVEIAVGISRAQELVEPLELEVVLPDELAGVLTADRLHVEAAASQARLRLVPASGVAVEGEYRLIVRGTVMQQGHLPVVSETDVLVVFVSDASTTTPPSGSGSP